MEFKCSICNYITNKKSNIVRHINNKTICGEGIREFILIKADIKCEHCNKSISLISNMKRHVTTCKLNKISQEDEIKILKEKLAIAEALVAKSATTVINNINTINNNTNIIIINLTSWKNPNYPDDMDKYYREAIKKAFMSVPNLIQNIHFNPDMPENQNICIKNFRTKLAKVFDGTKWITMDEDKLLNELINTYEGELENWADEKPARMKYIDEYKEIKNRDGRLIVEKEIKDVVKKLIYDNSGSINPKKLIVKL